MVVAGADERFAIGLAALGVSVIEHRGPKRPLEFHAIDAGLETGDPGTADALLAWRRRRRGLASAEP